MSKNYLTIGQLAEITGLSTHTLRYYERIGLLNHVERADNGRRYYTLNHLGWLDFVMRMRSTGMSIPDIIHYAELAEEGDATTQPRLALLENHQVELETQIENLQRDLQVLKDKIAYYKSLNMPDDYQPQQHHRWHLQLNPNESTQKITKLPTVIVDYLHAKSFQDGLVYINESNRGWNWVSKYYFLSAIQFLRQIFPDLTWHFSDIERQNEIYVFCAQPVGTRTTRGTLIIGDTRYHMPDGDFDYTLPELNIMMRLENGYIVELKVNHYEVLDNWIFNFIDLASVESVEMS